MSRRVEVDEKIRELARLHPGWTPSQIAIFLQGEKLKVTSEDVRRTLARTNPTPAEGGVEVAAQPRYATPRQEPHTGPWRIGLAFGLLVFALSFMGQVVFGLLDPALGTIGGVAMLVIGLLLTGSSASRRYASGAHAGMIAALVSLLVGVAISLSLYESLRPRYEEAVGRQLPSLTDSDALLGLAVGVGILMVVFALLGLIFGWMGARLFGRKQRRATFG